MANDNSGWLESLKHYVSAPRRAFEGMARPIDDKEYPTEYTTASPLVNISRGDIDKATEAAMAVSGGGMSTKPIRAYHSSPHDFERFDLSKIGTGEGAQVYGHGLYFAESPAVSGQGGQYWGQFLRRFEGPENAAAVRLGETNFDRAKAIKEIENEIQALRENPHDYSSSINRYQREIELLRSNKPIGPRTYEVNINADPAHMLDWDKAIKHQPKAAQEIAREAGMHPDDFELAKGAALYRRAGDLFGPRGTSSNFNVAATTGLREAGIPGIKYLDRGSRGLPDTAELRRSIANVQDALVRNPENKNAADLLRTYQAQLTDAEKATSNYVVFDPSILDIVKKYGLAGLAAPPAIAGAMKERQP